MGQSDRRTEAEATLVRLGVPVLLSLGLWAPILASGAEAASQAAAVTTIDIAAWQHPTKAVLAKYKVVLKSVTLQDRFATFQVEFPFDPQTEPNAARLQALCLELLRANGSWNYALVSGPDHLEIDVSWDKRAGRISIDNHPV